MVCAKKRRIPFQSTLHASSLSHLRYLLPNSASLQYYMKSCPAKKGDFFEFFAGNPFPEIAPSFFEYSYMTWDCDHAGAMMTWRLIKSNSALALATQGQHWYNILCALSTCPGGDLSVRPVPFQEWMNSFALVRILIWNWNLWISMQPPWAIFTCNYALCMCLSKRYGSNTASGKWRDNIGWEILPQVFTMVNTENVDTDWQWTVLRIALGCETSVLQ